MKKNISINISGIIFHIEEDGYETLRKYLDSINKYFSSFEDSTEIMADIESRIAEIFLSKLNEGKQVITLDDVNALVATMGSVSDFKAAEEVTANGGSSAREDEPNSGSTRTGAGSTSGSSTNYTYQAPRSFERDQKRKILGGVCAGLGHYLRVDPLWIRLVFVIFFFSGISIIAYIIMWIVIPGTYDLPEPEFGKKMFRDPDAKVLGGVSGGIASYFNIDILVVRILFVALAFASGFGVFLYIILWVILPEARTLTDRMQMQGEPVTLSNIETSIKKNQESSGNIQQESELTKVLLFPFRLLAALLRAIAKLIGPLAEALRIIIGVFVIGFGLTLLISALVSAGVALGIFSGTLGGMPWSDRYTDVGLPVDAFIRAFPGWTVMAGFLAILIPTLMVILLGISIIARRVVFSSTVGWSMFVIFLISVGMLSVGIPRIIMAFKQTGVEEVVTTYTPTGKRAHIKIREVGMDEYDGITLQLRGHEEKTFKLVQQFKAQGTTRAQALENIKMVNYQVEQRDSIFTFDSNILFKPQSVFRAQELNMILYIPYHYPLVLDESASRFIDNYIEYDNLRGNTWELTEKGLHCLTCPVVEEQNRDLTDFDQVEAHGIFDIRILQGDSYSVELNGPEAEKKKYQISRTGKTLVIDFDGEKHFNWDWKEDKWSSNKVHISITMPDLDKLEATGFGSIEFERFTNDDMEIEVRGPIKVKGEIETEEILINLNGKSEVYLQGSAQRMNADLTFASSLKAYDFEVQEARVEVNGASHAKVNVTGRLEMDEGMASDINYRGNPEVIRQNR